MVRVNSGASYTETPIRSFLPTDWAGRFAPTSAAVDECEVGCAEAQTASIHRVGIIRINVILDSGAALTCPWPGKASPLGSHFLSDSIGASLQLQPYFTSAGARIRDSPKVVSPLLGGNPNTPIQSALNSVSL